MISPRRLILFLIIGSLLGLAIWFWFRNSPEEQKSGIGPNQGTTTVKKYNRLGEEKSPYLLQHKDNPVHWFSWGDEALQAAREENKIIFLSIGYSTCYWCHVMEKDSFERQGVADVLNKDFISIKVDREERPDLDRIYMDAVVSMTGRGGWPMSVFLTPDGKPFFGGTFFRRAKFLTLLARIQNQWQNQTNKIHDSAEKIAGALENPGFSRQGGALNRRLWEKGASQLKRRYDSEYGGFGRAPKFPQSPRLSYLLRAYRQTGNEEYLDMATHTLDQMARGGMYDHLGGGFHRYSTDAKWFSPHFEKMLYDNAQLATTYLEAYQLTGKKEYAQIAQETLNYVLREMTHPEGGFYSAQDAGEVGREGEYYIWKENELRSLLSPQEFKAIQTTYQTKAKGNFHKGENILHLKPAEKWSTRYRPTVAKAHKKLLVERQKRTAPHLDDKVLTAWNGLMISALAKGYQVLGEEKYLKAAQKSARFIQENLKDSEGKLLRRWREGEAKIPSYLNDYAFLIDGLLNLYQSDFDPQWLRWAMALQNDQEKMFWDEGIGGYFFAQDVDKSLIVRKKNVDDGAIPSGNGFAALNLQRLKDLTFQQSYGERLQSLWSYLAGQVRRYPAGYPQTMIALDYFLDRSKEVAVVPGTDPNKVEEIKTYLAKNFLPNQVLVIGEGLPLEAQEQPALLRGKVAQAGKTTIYVCEDNLCKKPTHDLGEAARLMEER